jgi:hypothetical protein
MGYSYLSLQNRHTSPGTKSQTKPSTQLSSPLVPLQQHLPLNRLTKETNSVGPQLKTGASRVKGAKKRPLFLFHSRRVASFLKEVTLTYPPLTLLKLGEKLISGTFPVHTTESDHPFLGNRDGLFSGPGASSPPSVRSGSAPFRSNEGSTLATIWLSVWARAKRVE